MTNLDGEIASWVRALNDCAQQSDWLKRCIVVRETESTQDLARISRPRVGDLFTTGRQVKGRGRLGRTWQDARGEGVAVTLVLPACASARLSVQMAVAVASAVEGCVSPNATVGIKWPNDVFINDRKVAGILIEQHNDCALVGIGLNVSQTEWPEELAGRAISLHQAGSSTTRLDVLLVIVDTVSRTLAMRNAELSTAFEAADVLAGRHVAIRHDAQTVEGTVVRIDPMHGLELQTRHGPVFLRAESSSVLDVKALAPVADDSSSASVR